MDSFKFTAVNEETTMNPETLLSAFVKKLDSGVLTLHNDRVVMAAIAYGFLFRALRELEVEWGGKLGLTLSEMPGLGIHMKCAKDAQVTIKRAVDSDKIEIAFGRWSTYGMLMPNVNPAVSLESVDEAVRISIEFADICRIGFSRALSHR